MPPVLACFADPDARVRYYACESMYNIAKVAKGEILVYFNDVFDALSKLAADTELSVKNGAELLDRLVKDIVSESAATYASVLVSDATLHDDEGNLIEHQPQIPTAFSLPRFIPLLQERVNVQNPFSRTFLVSWITLLDQIPDLELVSYLPTFLAGLLRFLSDPNEDVHTTTKTALDRFLVEIRKIAEIKKGITESKRAKDECERKADASDSHDEYSDGQEGSDAERAEQDLDRGTSNTSSTQKGQPRSGDDAASTDDASSFTAADDEDEDEDEDELGDEWIPGQDAQIDYRRLLEILITFLSESREEEIQVTALKWIETFLEICPEDILSFTPLLLQELLPALSHKQEHVSQAAQRVNQVLMRYIMSLPEDHARSAGENVDAPLQIASAVTQTSVPTAATASSILNLRPKQEHDRRESLGAGRGVRKPTGQDQEATSDVRPGTTTAVQDPVATEELRIDLDYEAAVNALTLQFLHEKEATRVAALAWLIMLHRKSPRRILAIQDATFPALLKTLSDPAESVVTRDLLLLSQISKSSDDSYFASFMVNLLKLFCTDRRLLETRGNLIIRQLCLSLSAERIYRTMADCLERDEEDIEFASIMVQNLNNNLITAPELADLRKRLRNLDSRDGQMFFTVLFKAWCVNSVATFSLCLLAQAYEQAYNLLQIFCDIEMTVNMLIQIDKLVQLLESPVFTYLRMQLLEPERHPNLYKCLYGLLMLLPQSSAFAALKNRLNSVSAIGYLHIGNRATPATPGSTSSFERSNRLKSREEGGIKWPELFEKFRTTQDRVRRLQQRQFSAQHDLDEQTALQKDNNSVSDKLGQASISTQDMYNRPSQNTPGHTKGKSSLGNLGRFASSARAGKAKK